MIQVSSLGHPFAVACVSVAVHAAAFVVAAGHSSAPATSTNVAAVERTEIEVEPVPVESDDDHVAAASPAAAHFHTHTHPYPVPAGHDATPHDPSLVHVFGSTAPSSSPAPAAPAPASTAETEAPLPSFAMVVGAGNGAPSSPGASGPGGSSPAGSPATAAGAADVDGAPVPEQSVSTPARLTHGASPAYPTLARQEGVEADVPMELVVSAHGAVVSARILGHVGFGLDESALAAIRGYAFTPAIKDGRPTRVRMRWTMQFRLR